MLYTARSVIQAITNQVLLYAFGSIWLLARLSLRPLVGSSSAGLLGDLFRMGLELFLGHLFLQLLVSYIVIGIMRPLHEWHELSLSSYCGELSSARCAGGVVTRLGGRKWCN